MKRGFTDNPAAAVAQPVDLLLRDAESAIDAIRKEHPDMPVGIVGLSEGAFLATRLSAKKISLQALFLLSLPTRSIDDLLSHMFIQWPIDIASKRLDSNSDGILSSDELSRWKETDRFPFIGNPPFSGALPKDLDRNGDGAVSIAEELLPDYQLLYEKAILPMVKTPGFSDWYQSMKKAALFSDVAPEVIAPAYIYQGMDDAHLDWSWVVADQHMIGSKSSLRLFPELGHCLARADGSFGEFKTSGPFDDAVMQALISDVKKAF